MGSHERVERELQISAIVGGSLVRLRAQQHLDLQIADELAINSTSRKHRHSVQGGTHATVESWVGRALLFGLPCFSAGHAKSGIPAPKTRENSSCLGALPNQARFRWHSIS